MKTFDYEPPELHPAEARYFAKMQARARREKALRIAIGTAAGAVLLALVLAVVILPWLQ